MRKLLWLGVAAVFTGYCGVSYYAYQNPTSPVVQLATRLVAASQQFSPLVMSIQPVSGVVTPVETVTLRGPVDENVPPADPTPVLEAGAELQVVGFLDVDANIKAVQQPKITGSFVVDAGITEAQKPGESPNVSTDESACPRVMPYALDDVDSVRTMPHSDVNLIDPYDPVDFQKDEKPAGGDGKTSASDYHSRFLVCPYSGKCIDTQEPSQNSAYGDQGSGEDKGATEESEPVVPHKTKKVWIPYQNEESHPSHPDIDTMEYRPCDGTLNEFSNHGPF